MEDWKKVVIEYNPAVRVLFGYASKEKNVRGNVFISDVIQSKQNEQTKILNHNAIDRFTGGVIDGALFSEKVIYDDKSGYTITFKVYKDGLKGNEDIIKAFEAALSDVATGMLPLGGGVNRGNGCFSGKVVKDGREIGGI